MSKKFKLLVDAFGWPCGTIVTKCEKDPAPESGGRRIGGVQW